MITIDVSQAIVAFVVALGIPSAIMGVVIHRFERRLVKKEKQTEEKEAAQQKLMILLLRSTTAATALGEATAKAVQRIPDAHCNGDMHAALDYAEKVKHEQKDFLAEQGMHAIWD